MTKKRSRKSKKDSWVKRNGWILFFLPALVPFIVFPPLQIVLLGILVFLGIPAAMILGLLFIFSLFMESEVSYDKGNTVPALPYSRTYSRRPIYSERTMIEDTKIMIRKVDRRRGIKKEAYMRKRRVEITREVNDLDLLAEPERGWGDFPWKVSEYKEDEDEEDW